MSTLVAGVKNRIGCAFARHKRHAVLDFMRFFRRFVYEAVLMLHELRRNSLTTKWFSCQNWRRPNPFHGWCQPKQLLQFNLKFILLPCLKDEEERPVSVSTPKATWNVNDPAALVCFYLRFRFWQPDSRRKNLTQWVIQYSSSLSQNVCFV